MKRNSLLLILSVAIILVGCGYGFQGMVNNLPPDIKGVYVSLFKNRSTEMGLENFLTNEIVDEFTRSKMVKLVGPDAADAILEGEINSVTTTAVAHRDVKTSRERKVTVVVTASLKRTDGDKEVLWSQVLSKSSNYEVTDDTLQTERNRRTALEEICDNLAQKIHDRIFSNF